MAPHTRLLILLAALAASVLFAYFRISASAHSDPSIPIPYSNKEGMTMLAASTLTAKPPAQKSSLGNIPPIDLAAPKTVQTATFAMG